MVSGSAFRMERNALPRSIKPNPKEHTHMQTTTTDTIAPTQDERIRKLREELAKLGGSATTLEMPPDMEEEFLRQVLEYETAEPISLFRLLTNKTGAELPAPDALEDSAITIILMKTVQDMAALGAYLVRTNHLTDRELYSYLYADGLREEAVLFPENPSYAYVIDLTGSGSDEDNQLYLKHYASEEHRQRWAHDWPDDPIPEHEDPPFDRDRHLPRHSLDT